MTAIYYTLNESCRCLKIFNPNSSKIGPLRLILPGVLGYELALCFFFRGLLG